MTFAEAMAILGLCGIFLVFAEVFGWFALKRGESVEIRQATQQERDYYEARLAEMKRANAKDDEQ